MKNFDIQTVDSVASALDELKQKSNVVLYNTLENERMCIFYNISLNYQLFIDWLVQYNLSNLCVFNKLYQSHPKESINMLKRYKLEVEELYEFDAKGYAKKLIELLKNNSNKMYCTCEVDYTTDIDFVKLIHVSNIDLEHYEQYINEYQNINFYKMERFFT